MLQKPADRTREGEQKSNESPDEVANAATAKRYEKLEKIMIY
jgi:hypothetical protein